MDSTIITSMVVATTALLVSMISFLISRREYSENRRMTQRLEYEAMARRVEKDDDSVTKELSASLAEAENLPIERDRRAMRLAILSHWNA